MALWLILVLIGLFKLVIASLMLWLPFRSDSAMQMRVESDPPDGDDEGGSRTLPSPPGPHPRFPLPRPTRRGPHGSPCPSSPARVRTGPRRVLARGLLQR